MVLITSSGGSTGRYSIAKVPRFTRCFITKLASRIYGDLDSRSWLSAQDAYSGGVLSQLMRHAGANGDVGRVVAFQQAGHHAPVGQHGQRPYQSRPAAASRSTRARTSGDSMNSGALVASATLNGARSRIGGR